MTHEDELSAPTRDRLNELVDGIWEESTRLETVLVVHPYRSLRQALAHTLEHYGYRAVQAASHEQALRCLRQERPRVVILDLALGGAGEGEALTAALWEGAETRELPLLGLTSAPLDPEEAARLHLQDWLVLPVEQRALLAALDRALEPARRRAAAGPRLAPADEQCMLPLEDQLRSEHLSLSFRFPTLSRVELRPGTETPVRALASRLQRLGIEPEIEVEGGGLVLRYELTIADAIALASEVPQDELFVRLRDAFPELAARPEALRRRTADLVAEYRRLQRLAS